MGDQLIASVVTVATAIVGLAIIAVLVSKQANTSGVISAGGSAFAQDLGAAVSPVTGGSSFGSGFSAPAGLQF
jgi:PRD1 phage membrane DNA delivery